MTTTVNASAKHTATVIFLHGLGDTSAGWSPVARMLARRPDLAHIKWVLPTAPTRRVSGGPFMPSWYDIDMSLFEMLNMGAMTGTTDVPLPREDDEGMWASVKVVEGLVKKEMDAGIPLDRVVVGGFSQGCVVSLLTALSTQYKVAGVLGLSGYLGLSSAVDTFKGPHAHGLRMFWGHGSADEVIPYVKLTYPRYIWAEKSKQLLKKLGVVLDEHVYDGMGHSFCLEEEADIASWLPTVIPG